LSAACTRPRAKEPGNWAFPDRPFSGNAELVSKVSEMREPKNTAGQTDDFIALGAALRDALGLDQAQFDTLVRAHGIKHRKAYYLVNIANAFECSPIPREDLLAIGWTKLEMLKDRTNDPNLAELIDHAKALPVPEFRRVLEGKEPRKDRHVVVLNLTPEQFEVLAEAVAAHGGHRQGRNLIGREEALTRALKKLLDKNE